MCNSHAWVTKNIISFWNNNIWFNYLKNDIYMKGEVVLFQIEPVLI